MQAVPCSSICRPKGKGSKQLCGSPATMLHWPVHALLVSGGSASIRGKALNQKLSGERRACPWPCFPRRHFQSKKNESSWQRNRADPRPASHGTRATWGGREASGTALVTPDKASWEPEAVDLWFNRS